MEKLLSCGEVCEITGMSRVTLWKLRRDGAFPDAILLGTRTLAWRVEDLETWMDQRRVKVLAPPSHMA